MHKRHCLLVIEVHNASCVRHNKQTVRKDIKMAGEERQHNENYAGRTISNKPMEIRIWNTLKKHTPQIHTKHLHPSYIIEEEVLEDLTQDGWFW